jgi:HEAT repeat protein
MDTPRRANATFEDQSIEALADCVLRLDQFPLRSQAMRALADKVQTQPEQLALLISSLRDDDPSVRRRAAQTLGHCGKIAQPALGGLCEATRTDPIWTVREAAVHAVSAISWPALEEYRSDDVPLQLLEIALGDREPLVREAAIQGLANCMVDENVPRSVQLGVWWTLDETGLNHLHATRRCRAITAICQMPNWRMGTRSISRCLKDSHWKVRRTTLQQVREKPYLVLRDSPPNWLLPEFIKRLFDQHPIVRAAAREAANHVLAECRGDSVARLLERITSPISAVESLRLLARDCGFLAESEHRFRGFCLRRIQWHRQHCDYRQDEVSLADSVEDVVHHVLNLAKTWQVSQKQMAKNADSAKRAAEEKEASFLLARGMELYLNPTWH